MAQRTFNPARQFAAPQTICNGSAAPTSTVRVVRIGVIGTGHNLADDNAPKAAFHGFDLLEAFDFEADVRQDFSDLFGRKIGRDITFEPVIRNIHIVKF